MPTYRTRRVRTWRSQPRMFLLGEFDYKSMYTEFQHPEHGLLHQQINAFYSNYEHKAPTVGYLRGLKSLYDKVAAQSNLLDLTEWQSLSADMQTKIAEFEARVEAAAAAPPPETEPEPEPDPYAQLKEAVEINKRDIQMFLQREATETNLRHAEDAYYRIEDFTSQYMPDAERSFLLKTIMTSIQIFRSRVYPEQEIFAKRPSLFEAIAEKLKTPVSWPIWVQGGTDFQKQIYEAYQAATAGMQFAAVIDAQTGGPHPGAPGPRGFFDKGLFKKWPSGIIGWDTITGKPIYAVTPPETLPSPFDLGRYYQELKEKFPNYSLLPDDTILGYFNGKPITAGMLKPQKWEPIQAPTITVTAPPPTVITIPGVAPTPVTAPRPVEKAVEVPEPEMVTIGKWEVSKKKLDNRHTRISRDDRVNVRQAAEKEAAETA